MGLSDRIKQPNFSSSAQEVLLSIWVTQASIGAVMARILVPLKLTSSQYNVLRILRGSMPTALTCREIGERLLDRTPDVTRLLGRLEKSGHVSRNRAAHDQRVVEVRIQPSGLDLLKQVDDAVVAMQETIMSSVSEAERRVIVEQLERIRQTAETYMPE